MVNKRNGSRKQGRVSRNPIVTKSMVKQMIEHGKELKFFNTSIAANTSATPAILAITQPIIQGVGGGQRVGDDIDLKRIIYKFRVDMNVNNTVLSNVVRMIIFSDFQADAAAPVIADLLTGTLVTSLYNEQMVKSHRFKIHYDHIIPLSLNGPNVEIYERDFQVKHRINYTDTTNVTGANGKGAIFFAYWADTSVNHPAINGEIELRYTDS